jgi:hypothetical protein
LLFDDRRSLPTEIKIYSQPKVLAIAEMPKEQIKMD